MTFSIYRRARNRIRRVIAGEGGTFVQNLDTGFSNASYRALLYYKTDPFIYPDAVRDYAHTNFWEVTEIVRVLNAFGFVVDVIDRGRDDFLPEDKYDLFIGLGSGNSGRHFAKYAAATPRAVKVLMATGPMPYESNRRVQSQYDLFNARHGSAVPAMRLYENLDFASFVPHVDYLLVIGERDEFCAKTYEPVGKPILSYLPGTTPAMRFDNSWIRTRRPNKFLCFAGSGFICKGVDLVVEAFLETPELDLHVCGPDSEVGFFDVLGKQIAETTSITYEGFVPVGGRRFEQLLGECSFVIFASSSEGCATSVATVLRGGLVPIMTKEVGIYIGEFGFELAGPREKLIEEIRTVARRAAAISPTDYRERVYATLRDATKYTQASFTQTVTDAILRIMHDRIA